MKLDSVELGRLQRLINTEVDKDSIAQFREGPRSHLGASIMGDPCERKLWYSFRWVKEELFSGRMHRLFIRGHREEPHIVERLRRLGFQVWDIDPATGKQFRISGANGHYGGSGDGLGYAPAHYGLSGPGVFEFKTHNEKSFAKLAGSIVTKTPEIIRKNPEGVKKSKPMHFGQMSQYGAAYACTWGLYCAQNKETDELYFEFVVLDPALAASLYTKAERIVYSQTPPPKISESPAFFDCKYCAKAGVCHRGEMPDINCRSCVNAVAAPEGRWGCLFHNDLIPPDVIPKACPHWSRIA